MTAFSSKNGMGQLAAKGLFALMAFGFGAMGAAVAGFSPEHVVAGRFASALEQGAVVQDGRSLVQVAGTEDFWLKAGGRAPAALEPAAWSHPDAAELVFAVGDTVTVSRDGSARAFKVTSVSAPFKDGEAMAVRVTAEDATGGKAQPVVFTVPLPHKPEAGKPRAS